jgi:hypothetical protein
MQLWGRGGLEKQEGKESNVIEKRTKMKRCCKISKYWRIAEKHN